MIRPKEVIEAYRLIKNQWKSPEQIQYIQNEKLRRLIKHSYEKVPYYRQLFDSLKLKPEDVQSVDDLRKLPLLSKKTIKSLPLQHMIAQGADIKRCRTAKTTGSTSVPLRIYYNWQDARMIGIALVRTFLAFGVKPWYRAAEFFDFDNLPKYSRDIFPQKRRIFERIGIWRSWKLSPWDEPESWIEKLKSWKPQVLYGYFMNLKLLAKVILEKGVEGINPLIVINTSGIINEPTRRLLSSAFKAKVYDLYSSWEGGNIAWECPRCEGYHINSDMVIVELLKDGKPISAGQKGEVVITNLHSYVMPFIRYCQEDVVVLSEKVPICGRPFPLIKYIEGRLLDFIILPFGKRLSPLTVMTVICNAPEIDQFRILQEKIDLLSIEIVPTKAFNQSHSALIKRELRKLVGKNIRIKISLVKKIEVGPSYKRRHVISKILDN